MGLGILIPLACGLMIGFGNVREWYVAILVLLFLLTGAALFLRASSRHDRNASWNMVTSRTLLIIASFGIGALNLLALSKGAVAQQILATLLLGLSVYPMWRYLKQGETGIPFVPLIAIIYGVYYGLPALSPFEIYWTYRGVPLESKMKTQILVAVGLFVLLFVFFRFPQNIWRELLPQVSSEWSEVKAKYVAVVLGVLGMIVNIIFQVFEVPMVLGALITFCGQLSLVAIASLFLLHLRGRLSVIDKLFLWVCLVPLQVLVDIGSGVIYPMIRLGAMLLMLFILVKHKLPWRWFLIGVPIVMLLLVTKMEFRGLTWGSHTMAGNPIGKGILFLQVTSSFISSVEPNQVYSALEKVAQRGDLLSLLSYIVDETPGRVPYLGGETYTALLWKLIPRLLYPDKPEERLGQTFGHTYALLDLTDVTTSTNLPQLVEMYANFGIPGVMVGMFLLGLLYQILYQTLNHTKAGSWGLVSSGIIFSSLMNIEANFSLVYGGIVYWIVLLNFLGMLVRKRIS